MYILNHPQTDFWWANRKRYLHEMFHQMGHTNT